MSAESKSNTLFIKSQLSPQYSVIYFGLILSIGFVKITFYILLGIDISPHYSLN